MNDLRAIRYLENSKISHDYKEDVVTHFSYKELVERESPFIGIACKQSGVFVIDVDVPGTQHKKDGREFWGKFSKEYNIPDTYTVQTRGGGFHFYFKFPAHLNPETFSPPGALSPGVDVKWNGWVGAPPSPGYSIIKGSIDTIVEAPEALIDYMAEMVKGKQPQTFDADGTCLTIDLHRPFSKEQLADLQNKLEWMQENACLTRQEWRDGLFSLKAGVEDNELLHELATKWTMNKSYVPGDENEAISIVDRADRQGPIGPGSIFSIMSSVRLRTGAPIAESPFTVQEIIDRSKIKIIPTKDGTIQAVSSESNAASIIGAIFDDKKLYFDSRVGQCVFKDEIVADEDLVNIIIPLVQSPVFGIGLEKFSKSLLSSGLDVLMSTRNKDPHMEYLKNLQWDGVKRIDQFFTTTTGVEDNEYHRLIGRNFWTSLAARGLQNGIKFDSVLVLEGDEGIAKSSLVEAIGGQYTFAPSDKHLMENIDLLRQCHQSIIVEVPELLGLVGEDPKKVKAFISKSFDHIRGLFAKRAMKLQRSFVMVGTTNSTKYLSYEMGERRFWPIKIPRGHSVDISWVKAFRDQLFAEGVQSFKSGHAFWYVPKAMLNKVVEDRINEDPISTSILETIPTMTHYFTTTEVYRRMEGLGIIGRGLTPTVATRIENILIKNGYELLRSPETGIRGWKKQEQKFEWESLDDLI